MKFGWVKNKDGSAWTLGSWPVQKDWATGLWDIYHDGVIQKQNLDSAVEAMNEAERMGA